MPDKKKILVTGGAGFIGSHLVDHLLEKGYAVRVIDNLVNGKPGNLAEAMKTGSLEFIEADILDQRACQQAATGMDYVYHLACLGVRHSLHSPFDNHRVNAEGSLNVLEAALKNKVKRFFYISTSEIYGDIKSFPINEDGIPLPKTVYGSSKLAGENYAYSYHKCFGLDVTITRIFNNFGPRAHHEGDAGEIIPRSIVKILYGHRPVIFGDGSVTRDFFYVKDTARALTSLLDAPHVAGDIINIGTGIEITMKELLETILRKMGREKELPIEYLEDRPADVPRLWVDPQKFLRLTGFKADYDFESGMEETIAYYKKMTEEKNLLKDVVLQNWK